MKQFSCAASSGDQSLLDTMLVPELGFGVYLY